MYGDERCRNEIVPLAAAKRNNGRRMGYPAVFSVFGGLNYFFSPDADFL